MSAWELDRIAADMEGATSDANEAAETLTSVATGFDTTPVTATVSPAQGPIVAPERVETGFGDVSGAPAPVQQAAPTVDAAADAGSPEDPDVDLDARVAALFPN